MSKYIIQIPDDVQYVLLNGKADNKYYTAVRPVADLEELNSDYINEHFGSLQDTAYQKGLEDGKKQAKVQAHLDVCHDIERVAHGNYQKGLNDAWEAARKIVCDEGIDMNTLCTIFRRGCSDSIIRDYSAVEAIEKLKAYESKQKDRIEVGDEVRFLPNDRKGIVTACHVPDVYAENDKYAVFCGTTMEYVLRPHITKTGKHYDIASILEAMKS